MMMKKIVLILLTTMVVLPMEAQQNAIKEYFKKYFHHMDVGVTMGTTGFGAVCTRRLSSLPYPKKMC